MKTMKKIFAIISVVAALALTGCAKDFLNTDPTSSVSGTVIFETAEKAQSAVDGIYRLMYTGSWGSGWAAENGGLPAYILTMDLKADDHAMDDMGSGWFYYDYGYMTSGDWTGNAGHQYQIWNFFYTLISGTNYVIAKKDEMEGTADEINYVVGQAYAIRSYCYMWLVQVYQQNGGAAGTATRDLPGVPVYTEPTVPGAEGKGRGTVQDVYTQANADIDSAIARLGATNIAQQHPSHISLAVAHGIKARHALVQQDFATALTEAEAAMTGQQLGAWADVITVNDVTKKNVMWGLKIQKADQSLSSWDIYAHMDAESNTTYSAARHLITEWLYNQIPATDSRKAWWTPNIPKASWADAGKPGGSGRSFVQKKLVFTDAAASLGDHILMRTEEMYLIAAEAACKTNDFTKAKNYLKAVGDLRDTNYAAKLATLTDSSDLNADTNGAITTLMDEIILQRRIELWSENPRLFDIQRLGLCFDRANSGTDDDNNPELCSAYTSKVASANFILYIPKAEFDGNENMSLAKDQNPSQGKNK